MPVATRTEHRSSTATVRQSPESYGLAVGCPFANGRGNQPWKTTPFQACCSLGYSVCHCLAVDYGFSSMLNSQHYVSAKEQGSRLLKTPRGPLELLLSTRETWLAKSTPCFSECASNFLLHQPLSFWTPSSRGCQAKSIPANSGLYEVLLLLDAVGAHLWDDFKKRGQSFSSCCRQLVGELVKHWTTESHQMRSLNQSLLT